MLSLFKKAIFLIFVSAVLSSCVTIPTYEERLKLANKLANKYHWNSSRITTEFFEIVNFQPSTKDKSRLLTIYIEGDGLAWINRSTISTNPTPINPVALKLALQHPNRNVAYLARPCQFTTGEQSSQCKTKFWGHARFSPTIINAMNKAVSSLKKTSHAQQIQLVGFSGGAAIAALITAKRNDVVKLITVAGNLDHQAWSNYHKVPPLTESLNPVDFIEKLQFINQIHFIGSDDKVLPPFLIKHFVKNYSESSQTKVIELPKYTHSCCWEKNWPTLLETYK